VLAEPTKSGSAGVKAGRTEGREIQEKERQAVQNRGMHRENLHAEAWHGAETSSSHRQAESGI